MNCRDLLALASIGAAAWPLTGHAQQKAMPVIGYPHRPSRLGPPQHER